MDKVIDSGMFDELWSMEFDGNCSSSGSGAEIVLIPPQGKVIPYASN